MTRHVTRLIAVAALALAASGCATSAEWSEWARHDSHFATGSHLAFSLRNTDERAPRVTLGDIRRARSEKWWGKAVVVSFDQVIISH